MPRATVSLPSLLSAAAAADGAVGAFNVVLLEHAEAIVTGAERANLPVILQISENCIRYHGSAAPIVLAARAAAAAAKVPVAVHLDHVEDVSLVKEGIRLQVDSIMFDGSGRPDDENLSVTAEMVALCHEAGISVEAELGRIGGKGGAHDLGVRTDPDEARLFVEQTGVDALAVAVGTSHAMTTRSTTVDQELIRLLHTAVAVPLVLHGSSGLSDDELRAAVDAGMRKVNVSTHLNSHFTRALRRALADDPDAVDPRRYIAPARDEFASEVARLLRLLAMPM